MHQLQKQIDLLFGWLACAATFITTHFNQFLGAGVGLLSLAIMVIRFRKEWRHRND
jgi:hypothetical protein